MIPRWVGAAVAGAEKGFRSLKGHRDMPTLVAALREHDRKNRQSKETVDVQQNVAWCSSSRRSVSSGGGTFPSCQEA